MDAQSHVLHYENLSLYIFFFKILVFFDLRLSSYLSNMPTSFCVKVPALKDKTESEVSSTFGEGL